MFNIRVGDKYLGGVPLWQLTNNPEHRLKFTTASVAETSIARALDKYPAQSLDGYVIEEIGA